MVWIIVVICILILLLSLLWIPIVLFIDTEENQYYVQLKGLIKASVESHQEEVIQIRLNVLFMKFKFYPLQEFAKRKRKKKKKTSKKTSRIEGLKKVVGIIKSFEVRRFFLDVDTGDIIWNARLYPLCALINYKGGHVHVNFQGRNQLALHLQNRPINIIKSFIHTKN